MLLNFLVNTLEQRKADAFYLLDKRAEGDFACLPSSRVLYLQASLLQRHRFYKSKGRQFSAVLCFGNIPPTIELEVPVYTYFHNTTYFLTTPEYGKREQFVRWVKARVIELLRRNTNEWWVQTVEVQRMFQQYWNVPQDKVKLYPFYDEQFHLIEERIDRMAQSFLFVSDGHPNKMHRHLLKAFEKLAKVYPQATLHLTISHQYPELIALIEDMNKSGIQVKNLGWCSKQELALQYMQHAFLIYPSVLESFGLGLIEAAQYKMKILAADLPYTHAVIEPSAVFDPNNIDSIFNCMQAALTTTLPVSQLKVPSGIEEMIEVLLSNEHLFALQSGSIPQMDLAFRNYCYKGVPAPTVHQSQEIIEPCLYLAIRPNDAGSIKYNAGASGFHKILNYAVVYRLKDVYRKVLSRKDSEQIRNDKWLVCGIGRNTANEYFYFIHPFAQQYQSKIAIDNCWLQPAEPPEMGDAYWMQINVDAKNFPAINDLAVQLPPMSGALAQVSPKVFEEVKELTRTYASEAKSLAQFAVKKNVVPSITKPKEGSADVVLFGYGNYARTIVLPYIHPHLSVRKVHEVDPSLLVDCRFPSSTNPANEKGDEKFAAWLIAGFHHTHAGLAIEALKNDVIPVIEKPIATVYEELQQLEQLAASGNTPFFQCFQKRYQIFNDYIRADLQLEKDQAVHYKALVYEIPLPDQHWYNWPVSGTRIISNGCHWIDHFMYLNGYAACIEAKAHRLNDDELLLTIQLENGASGVITLSDVGSSRIGVREYIEVSVKNRRAVIIDSMHYTSESNQRILRKSSTDKLHALRIMYQEIGESIKYGKGGDSIMSLRSSYVTLDLDAQVKK